MESLFNVDSFLHDSDLPTGNDLVRELLRPEFNQVEDEQVWREYSSLGKFNDSDLLNLKSGPSRDVRRAESLAWRAWKRRQLSEEEDQEEYSAETNVVVCGADVADLPTEYEVKDLKQHELPVIGTYVSQDVVPGFSYVVRKLGTSRYCYKGQPKTLERIGMGYGKRLTFTGETLNSNSNYFWSDSFPNGYGFSIVAVTEGDRFVIIDDADREIGTATVDSVDMAQSVLSTEMEKGAITKWVGVHFCCTIDYHGGPHGLMSLRSNETLAVNGLAVVEKSRRGPVAGTTCVQYVNLPAFGSCTFYPEDGEDLDDDESVISEDEDEDESSPLIVTGTDVGDMPTQYEVPDLLPHEMPVIGTYVDRRVVPGFKYRVRKMTTHGFLHKKEAMLLERVGMGYGKRLTFAGNSLNNNENYFWSDSYAAGYAFSIEAMAASQEFTVCDDTNQGCIGSATIEWVDPSQKEVAMAIDDGAVIKTVEVTFRCCLTLAGGCVETEEATGLVTLQKEKRAQSAKVQAVKGVLFSRLGSCTLYMK